MKRLARLIASSEAMLRFPSVVVEHYHLIGSDHRPILLAVGGKGARRKKRFCFKDKWINMEGFQGVVEEGWRCCDRNSKQVDL